MLPAHWVSPAVHSTQPTSGTHSTGQSITFLKPPTPSQVLLVLPSQTIVPSGHAPPVLEDSRPVLEAEMAPVLVLPLLVSEVIDVVEVDPEPVLVPPIVSLPLPAVVVGSVVVGRVLAVVPVAEPVLASVFEATVAEAVPVPESVPAPSSVQAVRPSPRVNAARPTRDMRE
jgi:hypothetical protein